MLRLLLRLARIAGDVSAIGRGPGALGRRLVRRQTFRASNGLTRRLLRGLGL